MGYRSRRYRRNTKRKPRNTKSLIKAEIAKAIRRDEEVKQLEFIVDGTGGAPAQVFNRTGPSVYITPAIAQGTDQGQRVGNKVMLRQICIRGLLQNGSATVPALARIIFFRDLQCNGAVPPYADLLADVNAPSIVNSMYNQNFRTRFKVLYDKTFVLDNVGGATDQRIMKRFTFKKTYKPGKGALLKYAGTTGAIAQCQAGQIFALWLTDQAAGAQPFAIYDVDIKYTDA